MEGITCTCHVTRCNRFRHALARRRPPRAAMELSDMGPDLRFEVKKTFTFFCPLEFTDRRFGVVRMLRIFPLLTNLICISAEAWRASPGWSFPRQQGAVSPQGEISTQTPHISPQTATGFLIFLSHTVYSPSLFRTSKHHFLPI